MKIKKPYTITESEKNRIRGLHSNVKNLIREDVSKSEVEEVVRDYRWDDGPLGPKNPWGWEDKLVWNEDEDLEEGEICEDCGEVHEGSCGMYEYEDLEEGEICENCGEVHEGSCGMYEEAKGGKNRTKGPVKTDSKGRVMNPKDQPSCAKLIGGGGGCCYCGGIFQNCPCGPVFDVDDLFGEGKKSEMRETALPTGWTMRTPEEIEEENIMDDLYEVWSGHEDDKILKESMTDDGTIKEQIYELPLRFGNKRLTESQLIRMVNTIIK